MEIFYKLVRNLKPFGKYIVRFLSNGQIKARLRYVAHTYTMGFLKECELEILLNELKRRGAEIDDSILWCQEISKIDKKEKVNILSTNKVFINKVYNLRNKSNEKFSYFLDLAKQRKSVRHWLKEPVPDKVIDELIQAGIEAPCSCNRQSWKFLIIEDPKDIEFISESRRLEFIRYAPLLIIVLIDGRYYSRKERSYTPFLDASGAIQNILLAAHSYGLGACWINMGKCEISFRTAHKIFKKFGINKNMILISLIAIGYPAEDILKPRRADTKEYIYKS